MASEGSARAASASGTEAGAGAVAGPVRVRRGTRDDVPAIHRMILDLAAYEGVPDGPQLSVQDLLEDGFDASSPWFFCVVAEASDGSLAGHALCNRAYSSWTRRAYYIEDLYVRPEYRHAGLGKQLVAALCQMGVREGVTRMDWHVVADNAPARAFYARLGARCLRETENRAALRLDRHHIQRLADTAPADTDIDTDTNSQQKTH